MDARRPDPDHACSIPEAPGLRPWLFGLLLSVGVIASGYVLLWHGITVYEWVAAHLPLLMPLAVTILSIFTRATEVRNYEAVLKMSNDIAIGIISFDIWAVSASRSSSSGRVLVDVNSMIRSDFVLPFLLCGLLVAVGCVVLTHYPFKGERTKQRWLLVALLTSILVYIAPFGALEAVPAPEPPGPPVAELRQYTVVIPYQDPGITGFAPTYLRNRFFLRIEKSVEATSVSTAQALGVKRFLDGPDSDQVKSKSTTGEKVEVRQPDVMAFER